MSALRITNVRLVRPGKSVAPGELLVEAGRIAAVGPIDAFQTPPGIPCLDAGARLLTPGLIDVHTHGVQHHAFGMSAEHLLAGLQALPQYGVTTVVPTLVPLFESSWQQNLRAISKALPRATGVHVPGLHLEGPFIALPGASCKTMAGDLELLEEVLAVCENRVAVMSISPETPNILPVIETLVQRGIVPFITHTRAGVDETLQALRAGARHATHFYDVFYPPPETDPGVRPVGIVETMLADPRATVDFIADGVHVDPMAIRLAVAAKGFRGVTLITDSNIGAGLADGVYDSASGYPVRVIQGDAARKVSDGSLSGSALTMNVGIANLLQWLDLPAEQVWAMGTLNPATLLGLPTKGTLEPGCDADLVLWNDDLTPAFTWVGGRCVYPQSAEPPRPAT